MLKIFDPFVTTKPLVAEELHCICSIISTRKLTNERNKISNSKDLLSIPLIQGNARFILQTGTIIEAQRERTEETEVSGGGTIYRGSGHVHISSSTRTNLYDDFWLLTDSGQEIHYAFKNINFPTRPGHRVTTVILQTPPILELGGVFSLKKTRKEYRVLLWNHATKNGCKVTDSFYTLPIGELLLIGILLLSLIPLALILTSLQTPQPTLKIVLITWALFYSFICVIFSVNGKRLIRRKLKKVVEFLSTG